jgi:hypothetical protein
MKDDIELLGGDNGARRREIKVRLSWLVVCSNRRKERERREELNESGNIWLAVLMRD